MVKEVEKTNVYILYNEIRKKRYLNRINTLRIPYTYGLIKFFFIYK